MYFAVAERQVHPQKVDAYLAAFRRQVETWSRHHARTLQRAMVVQNAAPAGKDGDIPVVVLTCWRTAEDFTDAYTAEPPDQLMDLERQIAKGAEPFRGYRPVFEQSAYKHAAKLATVAFLTAPPGTTAEIEGWARKLAERLAKVEGVTGFRLLEVVDRPEEYLAVTEYADESTRDAVEQDLARLDPSVPVERREIGGAIRYIWMPLDQLVEPGR